MTDNKKKMEKSALKTDTETLLQEMKEFSLTVGEECPEGHRRDAASGACLPIGSTDHTAFTRSLNDDQGDKWRGLEDKTNETFAAEQKEQALLDAGDMDEPVSCGEGMTFSFIKRVCVSVEEAEVENADELEDEEGSMSQPEGRRDTPNHECPPDQMFDYKLRECIPLNKDTVMASEENVETAEPIKTKQRNALPSSSFGVPEKRKFPLDSCNRVRNAMARFNQAKGLSSSEKATLRRKILAAAKKCGVEVKSFAAATTTEEFANVLNELLLKERIVTQYAAKDDEKKEGKSGKGPCPPWMSWDPKAKKCGKMKGFHEIIKSQASHSDVIALDPEGRKDTPGFQCPPGSFFNFGTRKCLPLDPSKKDGTTTSKAAEEDAASRDLAPSPKGRPARLPQDCPKGTIWDADLEDCKPLDSRKKTKSAEDEGSSAAGPGKEKDTKGCAPGEFMNPVTKKCMPRKGAFKGKSEEAGDEGLVPAPDGKVKNPADCPPNTLWDGINKLCRPLDSMDKNRPSGSSPQDPANTASVEKMSVAQLIQVLDSIIKEELASGQKEKSKVAAKELPNEAFPPSLVSSVRRSLMHHTPEVADAYDNETVDVSRLRNALARVDKVEGHSAPAVEDARNHLLYHAREIAKVHLGKN